MRRAYLTGFIFITVCVGFLIAIAIGFYAFNARASISKLYADTCLGGWENTHLASGSPDALGPDGETLFDVNNSAKLNAETLAQIYCGGFNGDVLENTVPKKILVKFSWNVEYPEIDTVEESDLDLELATSTEEDLSATSTESLPSVEDEPVIEDVVEELEIVESEEPPAIIEEISEPDLIEPESPGSAPEVSADEPISFFNLFISKAIAQEIEQEVEVEVVEEVVVEDVSASSTDVSLDEVATTTEDAVDVEEVSYGLVEVVYTLDGLEWKTLGFVGKDEFRGKHFEIPIEEASDWEDISRIQIGVRSLPVLDGVAPVIFLDSVWIEAEYGFLEELIIEEIIEEEPVSGVLDPEDPYFDENPVSNELNLKTRVFNDFVIDSEAKHYCNSEESRIDLKKAGSATHKIQLFGAGEYQEIKMVVASLPKGIDVYFNENKDYEISFYSDKKDVEVELVIQEGAQVGNFNIPIIYTLKNDANESSVVCQINLVHL